MATVSQIPLESAVSSFSRCQLYYDFARGRQQRINHSIFTENSFVGDILADEYLDITNVSHRIGSNTQTSFSHYSVFLDVEFTKSVDIGYFWSADSTEHLNDGSWHREQYQFILQYNELGISNQEIGPQTFPGSVPLHLNKRYVIIYKSSLDTAELYINGQLKGSRSIYNHGIYSPYFIKLGGSKQPMKVYRYAFYGDELTSNDIREICNITSHLDDPHTDMGGTQNKISTVQVFGVLPIFLIPLCITMIIVVFACMIKHKRKQHKLHKKRKKIKTMHHNDTLVQRCNTNDPCVICMDHLKEYICTPCGHYCLCEECKNKVHKCPLCQAKCKSIIKVYKC
eukprot:279899_1